MAWRAIKWNNGAVITDDATYFKVCANKAAAQAQFDAWTIAKNNAIPVPTFSLTQMNARVLTGDARVPDGNRWGLATAAVNTAFHQFYQLSKTNKVDAAFTAISLMPLNDQKRIRNILKTAVELHMRDTQFFLGADKIVFIDIAFTENSNDPNLASLVAKFN